MESEEQASWLFVITFLVFLQSLLLTAIIATKACFCDQNINYWSVVLHVDGYNQASPGPGGNPGQMMGISGRRGPTGTEGTTNMGTPLMSDNGSMVIYPRNFNIEDRTFQTTILVSVWIKAWE